MDDDDDDDDDDENEDEDENEEGGVETRCRPSDGISSRRPRFDPYPVHEGNYGESRRCNRFSRETLPHILGFCQHGTLIRNTRHHAIRELIAKSLPSFYEVHQEVHCLIKDVSPRRVDIIAIDRGNGRAIIIDPTVRFETAVEQPVAVHEEKKTIYDPTIEFFRDYYHIQGQIEVFGLLIGARRTIPKFSVECFESFGIPLKFLKFIAIDRRVKELVGSLPEKKLPTEDPLEGMVNGRRVRGIRYQILGTPGLDEEEEEENDNDVDDDDDDDDDDVDNIGNSTLNTQPEGAGCGTCFNLCMEQACRIVRIAFRYAGGATAYSLPNLRPRVAYGTTYYCMAQH
ncbi:hypothetical protein ANN_19698 [Periplaneta americana]|uniref:Uncharacterized protein n=1 Tax=Periplaneta americana TaxID=6978 RepID=A0ABQ8SAT2_PERAM|nr:hypothetical protein ANN_19698 [Periplaneta americana]